MTSSSSIEHGTGLISGDFTEAPEPFALFAAWFEEAKASEPNDPDAMALATTDAAGLPDVRMVLLKQADDRGFVFFTNEESAKGVQLEGNPKAALVLHWKSLRRQIRARGPVERVSDGEANVYFMTRSRPSRIAASASDQSRPLASRRIFEERIAELEQRFEGQEIPRPAHWGGFRIVPLEIEFWMDRLHRMHERVRFTRERVGGAWSKTRLYP